MVTFLGAIVRRMGNWMPIAGTVDLMAQFGLDGPGVRTAVFRLKQRGWLAAETRGGARGYALTPLALKALASGDEIIWHARQPADLADGWCVVNFSVPESARAKRHQLRAHLTSLGFGNVGTAMWIAPARMKGAAEQAIAELGLDKYAAIFVGDYVGGQDLTTLLYGSWDLAAIDRRYQDIHRALPGRGRDPGGQRRAEASNRRSPPTSASSTSGASFRSVTPACPARYSRTTGARRPPWRSSSDW